MITMKSKVKNKTVEISTDRIFTEEENATVNRVNKISIRAMFQDCLLTENQLLQMLEYDIVCVKG